MRKLRATCSHARKGVTKPKRFQRHGWKVLNQTRITGERTVTRGLLLISKTFTFTLLHIAWPYTTSEYGLRGLNKVCPDLFTWDRMSLDTCWHQMWTEPEGAGGRRRSGRWKRKQGCAYDVNWPTPWILYEGPTSRYVNNTPLCTGTARNRTNTVTTHKLRASQTWV